MNGNNSIIVLLSASLEIHNKLISVDFFFVNVSLNELWKLRLFDLLSGF